jgi:hypothetical protein
MIERSGDGEPRTPPPTGGRIDMPGSVSRKRRPTWVDVVALILVVLTLGVIVGVLVENFMAGG